MDSETGATRSSDVDHYRFDLIHPIAMMALARVFKEGSEKYGDLNCERGFPISDLWNHCFCHMMRYLGGDRSEPHLAKVLWGASMMVVSESLWPELNRSLRLPGAVVPPEAIRQAEAVLERRRQLGDRAASDAKLADWCVRELAEVQEILNARHTVKAEK